MTTAKFPAGVSPYSLPGMKRDYLPVFIRTLEADESRALTKCNTVLDLVCEFYGLTRTQILGKSRKRACVSGRKVVAYILFGCLHIACTTVGEFLDRDHTTVLYYKECIDDLIETYPEEAKEIQLLASRIY